MLQPYFFLDTAQLLVVWGSPKLKEKGDAHMPNGEVRSATNPDNVIANLEDRFAFEPGSLDPQIFVNTFGKELHRPSSPALRSSSHSRTYSQNLQHSLGAGSPEIPTASSPPSRPTP